MEKSFDHLAQVAQLRESLTFLQILQWMNILVIDRDNHRIQKLTAGGHFLTVVGSKGTGPLQFKQPCGIVFNSISKKVYVTDRDNHYIQVMNSDLTFSSIFG